VGSYHIELDVRIDFFPHHIFRVQMKFELTHEKSVNLVVIQIKRFPDRVVAEEVTSQQFCNLVDVLHLHAG